MRDRASSDGLATRWPTPPGRRHAEWVLALTDRAYASGGMPTTRSSPNLVGRVEELAVLDRALQTTLAAQPSIVLIGGDAGVGKTRLVSEFGEHARELGARVLVGGCLDLGDEGIPYSPFLEALRALGEELPPDELGRLLGETGGELVTVAPSLAQFIDVPSDVPVARRSDQEGTVPSAADQARLFELMLALLDRLGNDRPLVLVLEDLHWSDPATSDLLSFLVRNLRRGRVMIVGTVRTEDLERGHPLLVRLAELGRSRNVERIDLPPLDLDEQREQLAGILGRPPTRGVAERIHARAEGNPFFAEELLASESAPDPDGRRGEDQPPRISQREVIPGSLRDILAGRVADLPEPAQHVLRVAAVAGPRADDDLLARVSGMPVDEVDAALRDVVDRRFLEVDPHTDGYRFRHAMLAEVVLADLRPGERQRLHEGVAQWLIEPARLAGGRPPTPAELALHWSAAGRIPEALSASAEASKAATAVHAYIDAHRQAERVLSFWDRVPDAQERAGMDRIDLLLATADAADLAGDSKRPIELIDQALARIDASEDPIRAGLLHLRRGYFHWFIGESQTMIDETRTALDLIPAKPPSVERARVVGALASALMPAGHYRESRELVRGGDRHPARDGFAGRRGSPADDPRRRSRGPRRHGDRARRACVTRSKAPASPDRPRPCSAPNTISRSISRRSAASRKASRSTWTGSKSARRVGLELRFGAGFRASAGDILLRWGRWDEAERMTREGLELDDGDRSGALYLRAIRVTLLAARGEREALAAELETLVEASEADVDPDVRALVLQARAEAALIDGRADEALETIQRALSEFEGSDEILLVAPMLIVGMTAAADVADQGRAFRDAPRIALAEQAGETFLTQMRSMRDGVGGAAVETPSVRAAIATAEAEAGRLAGSSEAASWVTGRRGLGRGPDALPRRLVEGTSRRGDPARPRTP